MKVREKVSGRIALALVAVAVTAILVGCPNLSRDLDLKAQIEEDVREANADQVSIQVIPESGAMGSTTPSGTTSAKIGVAFQISASAFAEYAFLGWEKTAGDGEVSFANAASPETMATITGSGTGIVITARFDARPVVVIKEPEGTGALRNAPIAITFSEDIDDSTVILDDTITVRVSPDRITWAAPVGMTFAKSVIGSLVTVSVTSGRYEPNYYVRVDVLKSVTDLAGNMMPAGMFWWFKTGIDDDSVVPTLSALSIKEGATVIPDGGATRLTTGLTIATTATDNLTVTTMRVKETDLTTTAWGEITRTYAANLPYTLQTSGDGTKLIEVVVLDGANNESTPALSRNLVLDTVVPTLSSASINGGAAVTTSTTVGLTIGATDDRSGLAQYQLSEAVDFSGGTTTAWTAWTPTPSYTLSAGDGIKTVYARVRDTAGNISTEAVLNHDSITMDAAGPTFSSTVSINTGAATTTSTSVSLSISATDTGSSVAFYRLSEAPDFSGVTTTSWTPWTGSPQTAPFTLSSGDGTKNVYVQLRDANNNLSTETTTNHDSITLDAAGPTFTSAVVLGSAAASTASTTVAISISATDVGSSVAHYRLSEAADFTGGTTTAWTVVPLPTTCSLSPGDGSKTIYVQLRDANSNVSTESVINHDSITLDQTGPTFSSAVVLGGAAAYTGSTTVSISISATDAGSTVSHYRLSEASDFTGGTTTAWTAVPLPTTCSLTTGNGLKTIYVQLRDSLGNVSTEPTLNHDSITLDQLGPSFSSTVSINSGAALTTNPAVSLSISATDAASGIADYQLSEASDFTGGTTTSWTTWTGSPQTAPCTLSSGDGAKTVYVRLRDNVGNLSTDTTQNFDSITLDDAGPTFSATVSINSAAAITTSTSVSLSISATDTGSAVKEYRLSEASDFSGGTTTSWTTWTGSPQTAPFTLSTGDGTKNVYVQLRDTNNNLSTETVTNHDDIKLDQVGPTFSSTVSINSAAARTRNATISIAISASDAGSSIAEYQLSEASDFTWRDDDLWTAWAGSPVSFTLSAGDGTKNVYVRLKDLERPRKHGDHAEPRRHHPGYRGTRGKYRDNGRRQPDGCGYFQREHLRGCIAGGPRDDGAHCRHPVRKRTGRNREHRSHRGSRGDGDDHLENGQGAGNW